MKTRQTRFNRTSDTALSVFEAMMGSVKTEPQSRAADIALIYETMANTAMQIAKQFRNCDDIDRIKDQVESDRENFDAVSTALIEMSKRADAARIDSRQFFDKYCDVYKVKMPAAPVVEHAFTTACLYVADYIQGSDSHGINASATNIEKNLKWIKEHGSELKGKYLKRMAMTSATSISIAEHAFEWALESMIAILEDD